LDGNFQPTSGRIAIGSGTVLSFARESKWSVLASKLGVASVHGTLVVISAENVGIGDSEDASLLRIAGIGGARVLVVTLQGSADAFVGQSLDDAGIDGAFVAVVAVHGFDVASSSGWIAR